MDAWCINPFPTSVKTFPQFSLDVIGKIYFRSDLALSEENILRLTPIFDQELLVLHQTIVDPLVNNDTPLCVFLL